MDVAGPHLPPAFPFLWPCESLYMWVPLSGMTPGNRRSLGRPSLTRYLSPGIWEEITPHTNVTPTWLPVVIVLMLSLKASRGHSARQGQSLWRSGKSQVVPTPAPISAESRDTKDRKSWPFRLAVSETSVVGVPMFWVVGLGCWGAWSISLAFHMGLQGS